MPDPVHDFTLALPVREASDLSHAYQTLRMIYNREMLKPAPSPERVQLLDLCSRLVNSEYNLKLEEMKRAIR